MASVPNLRIHLEKAERTAFTRDSLEALPFPAAILNEEATIALANTAWTEAPHSGGVGQPFERWCGVTHFGSPELAASLLAGAHRAIHRGERFSQRYGPGDCSLITVSPCDSGALVLHQDLCPSPERMRAQKMETMGRLMAGVAHDFANVITLIDGYSDILLKRIGQADPLYAELDEIRKAAGHGARLTSQLLTFTRGQSVQPVVLDLNLLIAEMEHMLRPIIGEHLQLETTLPANLHRVLADPGQMEQVIVNLILNARDAMSDGGSIRIATANFEIDEAAARLHGVACGPAVMLSISDSGSGIHAEDMHRLFEPFFTTKEKGKGTGLGLSTVRDIIRQSGGNIWARSEPGRGTTFDICLPGVRQSGKNGSHPAVSGPPQPGHETVLLVEDEESVRRLLTHLLSKYGYQVLEAAHGEEALRIFERRGADIHLVLTDMVMPGMSGRALAEKLRELRPELRVLFMSGYTNEVLNRTGALSAGMSFLQKPLRPEVLVARVREALDSTSLPFNPR